MNTLLLFIFPALMAFAACSDLITMRLSNRLVLATIIAYPAIAYLAGVPFETMGMHALAGLAVLAVTFSLFAMGWIGGGDAKFAAATALWFGFELMLPFLLYASLLGGGLTLALLGIRRFALPLPLMKVDWIERLHNPRTGVPYGIALAAAALLIYPHTAIFAALAG